MSLVSGVNGSLPASAAQCFKHVLINMINTLVSAGWIRKGEGNASSYTNEGQTAGPYGVLVTSAASWVNNGWIRIREPVGSRELVVRFTADNSFTIHYSRTSGFTSGGAAGTKPTATDEAMVASHSSLITNANMRPHCVAENAAHNGAYHFWAMGIVTGQVAPAWFLIFDPLDSGQCHPDNDDPIVIYVATTTPATEAGLRTLGSDAGATPFVGSHTWRRYGQAGGTWIGTRGWKFVVNNGTDAFPGGVPVNPFSGKDDVARMLWGRDATDGAPMVAGASRYVCWKGVSSRAWPDTYDLASADARAVLGDLVLRWPTGTTPTA